MYRFECSSSLNVPLPVHTYITFIPLFLFDYQSSCLVIITIIITHTHLGYTQQLPPLLLLVLLLLHDYYYYYYFYYSVLLWRILNGRGLPNCLDGTPLSQVLVFQPPQSRLPSIHQCPASISLCPHMCPPRIVFPMCYAL